MNKKFWLTAIMAATMFGGVVMADDDAAPKEPKEPKGRGSQMQGPGPGMMRMGEEMRNSPEFKAMQKRRSEINKLFKEYKGAADADKAALETKIKTLMKEDFQTMHANMQKRIAENRARLDEMEKKLNERATKVDETVNTEFENMKAGRRPRMERKDGEGNGEHDKGRPERARKGRPDKQKEAESADQE